MKQSSSTLAEQVAQARHEEIIHGTPVMQTLRSGFESAAECIQWIGEHLDLATAQMQQLSELEPDFQVLSFSECARLRCAVARSSDKPPPSHRLLITDPFDTDRLAWSKTKLGCAETVLISDETLDAWLAHCEANLSALSDITLGDTSKDPGRMGGVHAEVLSLRQIGSDDSPAIRFVNSTLYDALKTGASDIHLESDPHGLAVKFRIDGVLNSIRHIDSQELAAQSISRIKVMSQLDIAERRIPQDGRLQISYDGRSVDVRVSIMPSIQGEDAVLRILDRQHLAQSLEGLTLAKLGFDSSTVQSLHRLARKPHGMLLVTGPTGSGKTTTLYAAIAETHNPRDKIITIEDPVEYQLPGVLQIPVNEKKGLSFARGLRSILRHDPDKILVGEIRDAETAKIAVQSALTGHLVFTTVHANNAFDVIGRFTQFDIDVYTLASAINGILAQRLMRLVCVHCARPAADASDLPSSEDLSHLSKPLDMNKWVCAHGCERCRGTGYAGRLALGELLELTPTIKSMIANRAPLDQLQNEAQRNGWRHLRSLALETAARGLTTMEEVDRVAG